MSNAPFEFAYPNYVLAPSTLYNIGGPADMALIPRNEQEALDAYAWMLHQPGKKLILGGGSNVLIADEGYRGTVLFTNELKRWDDMGNGRYFFGSGLVLDDIVQNPMLEKNYAGVGGLTGIPGSVGGAIYMNAGTIKGTICQLMESVEVLTPGGISVIPMSEDLYGYRGQTFCDPGGVILGGAFKFQVAEEDQTAIYRHYKQRRVEKQPQGRCCGSVFKNPEGGHAGRLIEECGIKGTRHGGALISPMHANFIMNEDNARFADVIALIELARNAVWEKFGIRLEEEVKIIGS
ncbi:MAG: UDP-N-acetylmuramate dehydrogenase [Candidatus Hydrogenedentes bacterium]|nr:UDP-N-acetylmuramate dehydrogenase [Candidatus Hydrogenedentota bacterium]